MDAIRMAGAYRCGLRDYWDARQAPSTPMLIVLSAPAEYRTCTQGDLIEAREIDLVVRQFASGSASKTLAGTLTATTGLACRMPGTLPHRLLTRSGATPARALAFGHPSGVIHVEADVHEGLPGETPLVRRIAVQRTARRLAEGRAFLKHAMLP